MLLRIHETYLQMFELKYASHSTLHRLSYQFFVLVYDINLQRTQRNIEVQYRSTLLLQGYYATLFTYRTRA